MLKKLLKWIKGPTPEEMKEQYDNGAFTARVEIIKADDKSQRADELYKLCDGAFSRNSLDDEFDRGLTDQLAKLGYGRPYSNGRF